MQKGQVQTSHTNSSRHIGSYQYLLVARPGKDLIDQILTEKQNFSQQYGTALADSPHITITSFQAREEMEETIIRYMQRICNRLHSFSVELNNYSGFPPHSIYLRVQNPQPFRQLTKELQVIDNYICSCACPPLNLVTHPHVSIAAKLTEHLYLKALMDYGQKTFHELFTVQELVLLRKKHDMDTEKSINVFRLQPADKTLYN